MTSATDAAADLDGRHLCPRRGCTRTVANRYLMCGPDWARVPRRLQAPVYRALREHGVGSAELRAAQVAAIRAVNEPEP